MKDRIGRDLLVGVLVVIVLYILGLFIWDLVLPYGRSIPLIDYLVSVVEHEFAKNSLKGLTIMTFLGGLFFIGYPAELVFLMYARTSHSLYLTAVIMIISMTLAQLLNYWFGYFLEKKIIHRFVKDQKKAYLRSLKRYDVLFIVIINFLPLPADILTVLLGMIRYDLKKTMLYTFLGKVIKYFFLIVVILIIRGQWPIT